MTCRSRQDIRGDVKGERIEEPGIRPSGLSKKLSRLDWRRSGQQSGRGIKFAGRGKSSRAQAGRGLLGFWGRDDWTDAEQFDNCQGVMVDLPLWLRHVPSTTKTFFMIVRSRWGRRRVDGPCCVVGAGASSDSIRLFEEGR